MPDGGTLTISTFNLNVEEREPAAGIDLPPLGSYAAVAVTDTGTGMDEETAARVFDPFFTTKQIGKGTGLGLAIVRGIVEQSGGHVSLKSTVGQGTTFIVSFPAAAGASPADAVTEAPSPADRSGRDATVLVVDDEESLARVVATTLREHGFAVLETASPVDALKRFLASEQQIDVLVTDVVMPGMRGPVLAERLRERHPNMRVLYISGYTDDSLASGGSLSAGAHFLRKPFTQEELARSVTEALPA
jgi:CheY-like chemotaxis protein